MDQSIISPILIGRTQEFATLEGVLAIAKQGRGQALLIAGDAGVGKSRLLHELSQRASEQDFLVITGRCFDQDAAFPYSLWIDALRNDANARPQAKMGEAFGPFGAELLKLLPELAYTLPVPPPAAHLDPETEKRRIFDGLVYFFTHLARTQPLLLLVEDLHWSDKTSLDFLYFLIRRLSSLPLLLLISYRPQEAPAEVHHFLAQLDRARLCHEISLPPLTASEVKEMVGAILESTRALPSHFAEAVYRYTEGNPFFVEEILKLWLAAGNVRADAGRGPRLPANQLQIPRSVLDTVQQRTAHLAPATRALLALAAVIGRRFDIALLSAVTAISEAELLPLLKELVSSQLVAEESADQFAFRHALTREAIYGALLRRERREYHRRIAETMAQLYASTLERHWGELAYHAFEAGLWQQALVYSTQAGQQAQTLHAAREAIVHFTRALDAAHAMGQPSTCALLRERGKAYEIAGDLELARADYEQTLALAQQEGDGTAEWQALVDLGFLWAAQDYARTGDYFQRALALARRLNQPTLVAHSLNRAGNWYANVEQPAQALRYHDEALALFSAADDRRGLAETHDLLGMAHQLNSDLLHAYQAYQQAIALWQALQDRAGLVSSQACLPLCTASYLKNLDLPAIPLQIAIDAAQAARKLAQEMQWRAGEAFSALILAMCLGSHGQYSAALEAAQSSLHNAEEIEHSQWIIGAHVALGTIYYDLLDFENAHTHLSQAFALAQAVGSQVWIQCSAGYLASTYVAAGSLDEARALLDQMLLPDTPMQLQGQRLCWFAKAEMTLAGGDATTTQQIVEQLLATTAHLTPNQTIPRLALLLGRTVAAQSQDDQAAATLHAALALAELPYQWRIHVALGRLYQSQNKRAQAGEHFSAARTCIHTILTNIPSEEARQRFQARALAMLPTPASPTPTQLAKQQAGGLTAREHEIALLLAQGKSNQEIATTLFVGVRTVEAHITRILTKLDFTSRVQIAAWVVERKLSQ